MSQVRMLLLVVCILGGAVPGTAWSQALPADSLPPRSPLELLLEHRASLELTSEQLARLDLIRDRLARQNDPLVRRMMMLRSQWQQERHAARMAGRRQDSPRLQRIRAAAEPVHERIQANNRSAMQAVNAVLTPGQRLRLRGLVESTRGGTGRGPGGGLPPAGGR